MSTSGSLHARSKIHDTIADFILDLDIRCDTFPRLHRHSLCLSEYITRLPSTHSEDRLDIGLISDTHNHPC
jgi:hypothetical protein